MSQQITEKLKAMGLDPFISVPVAAEALCMSPQTFKNIARRREPLLDADGNPVLDADGNPVPALEIIRLSERRCGIRQSIFERYVASRKSAVAVTGKRAAPRRLGAMAKRDEHDHV
jgi:hypothetical protein